MSKKKTAVALAYVSSTRDGKFSVVHGATVYSRETREEANRTRDLLNGVTPEAPAETAAEEMKYVHGV